MDTIIEFIKNNIIDIITLLFAVIGGFFALTQWRTQVMQKRAETVKELICKVRDDEDIAAIMDIIDWNDGIVYNGKFRARPSAQRKLFAEVDDDKLFQMIDKTLSHFSYICYLRKRHVLQKKDMYVFEYELRRLADNVHIQNYLYSLYHWSSQLGVNCSFGYLIEYALKMGYLTKDFLHLSSGNYKCYLAIPNMVKE